MVMNVPKGTKRVLYIKDLAYDGVKHQEEILFDRGLTYTIRNAKIEKNVLVLECDYSGYANHQ